MVLNMAYGSNLTGADVIAATAEEAVGFLNAGKATTSQSEGFHTRLQGRTPPDAECTSFFVSS